MKSTGLTLVICGGSTLLWMFLSGWSLEQSRVLLAQERPQGPGPSEQGRDLERGGPRPERGGFGPGGPEGNRPVGPGGPGGFGPPQDQEIVKQFDKDGDKILNHEERQAARKWLSDQGAGGRGGLGRGRGGFGPPPDGFGPPGGGFGPPGGFSPPPGGFGPPGERERVAGTPGPKVSQEDVQKFPGEPLYSPKVVRTLFVTFEHDDWEDELAAFKNTDVEVPATLVVDGTTYPEIGVSFRGMSSFMMIPTGSKRSLKLSLDFQQPEQKLYGYKTLNLLNCNGDPSMMSGALYSRLVREHIPAPKVNFVKVVINGESWGIYANAQQFNKDFLQENYGETDGARWKASGNPGADAGLRYLGENISDYKQRFEIKSKDKPDSWKALINLCRVLEQTPPEKLEEALAPILDIDEVLWFLAYDIALVNEDGYWTRASDYNLYLDSHGKFHVIPHDMNETFHAANGQAGFGGPRPEGGGPGGPDGPPFGRDFFPPPDGRPPEREGPGGSDGPERPERPSGGPPPGRNGFPPPGDERFPPPGGGGMRGGPRGGMMRPSVTVDPLVAINNPRMPLHSKLLAVPKFREQYLANIREIAEKQLDWNSLGPLVAEYRELLNDEVNADTRKLTTYEAFVHATADSPSDSVKTRTLPLRTFADQRQEFLLKATAAPTAR
ncbi:CotH kinase family protein [Planctomicrobium sp. SH661]|uniref:CotH kinase family protein n=1 Tax=Planctomicrobium sp. SH661 TaxID=3448124 RepID=UPI003F5B9F12